MSLTVQISPQASYELAGASIKEDPIDGATLGGGEFSVDFGDVLSNEAANIFVMRSLGMTLEQVRQAYGYNTSTIQSRSSDVMEALGVPTIPAAIHVSFSLGLFDVVRPTQPAASLQPQQQNILEGLASGMTLAQIASSRDRSIHTVNTQHNGMRRRLGAGATYTNPALTLAHLSGRLEPEQAIIRSYTYSLTRAEAQLL